MGGAGGRGRVLFGGVAGGGRCQSGGRPGLPLLRLCPLPRHSTQGNVGHVFSFLRKSHIKELKEQKANVVLTSHPHFPVSNYPIM
jgi:hypothetical protein